MTSPSSHVFYPKTNWLQTREEGDRLVRAFVSEKKVTVFEKQLVRTRKSGVLFEKVVTQRTLSLHENSHGQKYLKLLKKNPSGGFADVSLQEPFNFEDDNYSLMVLLRGLLLDWFGSDMPNDRIWRHMHLESMVIGLMFPALREQPYTTNTKTVFRHLGELQAIGHPVLSLLRECRTWDEFLQALCPNLRAEEDTRYLKDSFCAILHAAVLPLGMSLTEFREKYGTYGLRRFRPAFSLCDHTLIRFILENSTPEERQDMIDDLMAMTDAHTKCSDKYWVPPQIESKRIDSELDFREIPRSSWRSLANLLRLQMKTVRLEIDAEGVDNHRIRKSAVETGLCEKVRDWYTEKFFIPSMETERTVGEVESRFSELFHSAPWDTSNSATGKVQWKEVGENSVGCALPVWRTSDSIYAPQFCDLLLLLIRTIPKNKLPKQPKAGFRLWREVYSIDEVLEVIETGTALLDAELTRLGRPATPENRTAYLRCNVQERKFKNTWRYYDLGVTNSNKILALKKCGVRAKKDIEMYNSLPDEMFYELLSLGAGKELTIVGGFEE